MTKLAKPSKGKMILHLCKLLYVSLTVYMLWYIQNSGAQNLYRKQLIRNKFETKTEMVELTSTNGEQFIRTCIYITSHAPRKISNALLNSSTLYMYSRVRGSIEGNIFEFGRRTNAVSMQTNFYINHSLLPRNNHIASNRHFIKSKRCRLRSIDRIPE